MNKRPLGGQTPFRRGYHEGSGALTKRKVSAGRGRYVRRGRTEDSGSGIGLSLLLAASAERARLLLPVAIRCCRCVGAAYDGEQRERQRIQP